MLHVVCCTLYVLCPVHVAYQVYGVWCMSGATHISSGTRPTTAHLRRNSIGGRSTWSSSPYSSSLRRWSSPARTTCGDRATGASRSVICTSGKTFLPVLDVEGVARNWHSTVIYACHLLAKTAAPTTGPRRCGVALSRCEMMRGCGGSLTSAVCHTASVCVWCSHRIAGHGGL